VETGKFPGSAQNSMCRGKLWSLLMTITLNENLSTDEILMASAITYQ